MDCLYLVKNGVPFDVAFSLDEEERMVWVVALGQLAGLQFDWDKCSWRKA